MTAGQKAKRQGQRGAVPKALCPVCGEYMHTAWVIVSRKFKRVGLTCACPECGVIRKDGFDHLGNKLTED